MYVGITCQKANRRWRNGRGYYQNIRMTNAIKKYGWDNIKHVILCKGLSIEAAETVEKQLIARYQLQDARYGYNYAEGGTHPRHTAATKKRIGEKSKGRHHSEDFKRWISEHNSGANNYMYGKHHTEETKQKISASKTGGTSVNKGKFGSAHPCAKGVIAIDPETGKEVARFGSIKEAAAFIGRYPSGIQAVLHGAQNVSGGYSWRRADG
jgi:group I intron endonuclease